MGGSPANSGQPRPVGNGQHNKHQIQSMQGGQQQRLTAPTHLHAARLQRICAGLGELDGHVHATAVDHAHSAGAATALWHLRVRTQA